MAHNVGKMQPRLFSQFQEYLMPEMPESPTIETKCHHKSEKNSAVGCPMRPSFP
jgi:hypothetical protein